VSVSTPRGACSGTNAPTVTCFVGTLPGGTSVPVDVVVRGVAEGTAPIHVAADFANADPDPTSPYAAAGGDHSLWVHPPLADLSVSFISDPGVFLTDPYQTGQEAHLYIRVHSDGPSSVGSVVHFRLPAGASLIDLTASSTVDDGGVCTG